MRKTDKKLENEIIRRLTEVTEQVLLAEFAQLLPAVQAALRPILNKDLPAKQIEARREHRLH